MSEKTDQTSENHYYPYQDKDKYGVPTNPKNKDSEESKEEDRKPIPFKCSVCGLNEVCHYFGRKPPFARGKIEYVEDTFAMMDPFCPREKGRPHFLTIGGKCRYCDNEVCVDCRFHIVSYIASKKFRPGGMSQKTVETVVNFYQCW